MKLATLENLGAAGDSVNTSECGFYMNELEIIYKVFGFEICSDS